MGPRSMRMGSGDVSTNEELHSLYRSLNIMRMINSRRLRWAGHVDRMKESRSAFKMLTGKPTRKRPLGRPRHRWEDLEEIGLNAGNWVDSVYDRDFWKALVNAALNLRDLKLVNINIDSIFQIMFRR